MVKKLFSICGLVVLLVCAPSGCIIENGPETYPVKPLEAYLHHKVRFEGETLWAVSAWYTGSPENWRFIATHNPKVTPEKLKVGTTILIPSRVLRTRENMPERFLRTYTPEVFLPRNRSSQYNTGTDEVEIRPSNRDHETTNAPSAEIEERSVVEPEVQAPTTPESKRINTLTLPIPEEAVSEPRKPANEPASVIKDPVIEERDLVEAPSAPAAEIPRDITPTDSPQRKELLRQMLDEIDQNK